MTVKVIWAGKSGQEYTFETYPIGTEFNPVSGVYIACKETSPGSWEAIYVGETQSLFDRLNAGLANHDGLKCANTRGATHIAAIVMNGEANRLGIETDLRHGLNPVCNKQRVTNPASLFYKR